MRNNERRRLFIIADDFGIGSATSAGILDLARKNVLTGTALLVNSPYAEAELSAWRRCRAPLAVGWHPNLTLDKPLLPPERVPSLVGEDGSFWPLGVFIKRQVLGRIKQAQVALEWQAQYHRFIELVGHPPTFINSHQHVAVFASIGAVLLQILSGQRPRPYVRRLREPWPIVWSVRGARKKRAFLNTLGRRMSRWQQAAGFPGSDWLAGVTDPPWVRDDRFFANWLQRIPGNTVELSCHPGYWDRTLVGRDCGKSDGLLQRRVDEMRLLSRPDFLDAVRQARFEIVAPEHFRHEGSRRTHAA